MIPPGRTMNYEEEGKKLSSAAIMLADEQHDTDIWPPSYIIFETYCKWR
jgi:hypothetical protein